MTVKELIQLLQEYPNQDMTVKIMHFEDGESDITHLEEQQYYVGCTHYPRHDKLGFPILNSGTYQHNESCRLEVTCVTVEY